MSLFHVDTDVLVWGCSHAGAERDRLFALLEAGDELGMSAWAWYEFRRGPRTAEQLAAAAVLLGEFGVVPVSSDIAEQSADVFRSLGSPARSRRRHRHRRHCAHRRRNAADPQRR